MKDMHPQASPDDLQAYVDGDIGEDRRRAVEAYLQDNPEAAVEVADLRRLNDRLVALYGPVAEESIPARLNVRRMDRDRFRSRAPVGRSVAAAIVLVMLGLGGGWQLRGETSGPGAGDSLVADALDAHRLYGAEVLHPVEVRAEESAHLKAWLSKRLERPLVVPNLQSFGLSLLGGRLLPSRGSPAAQFMYEDESGRRLTLYLIPSKDGEETAFRHLSSKGLAAVSWDDETIRCAMVGAFSIEQLTTIATAAYGQLG